MKGPDRLAGALGWQLESTTTYGGPDRDYPFPPYGTVVQFWALLVFRAADRGRI